MKLSLCVLACVCVYVSAQQPRPPLSETALEDALNDKRFIQRQLKCALGEAPCDPIGKRLKTLAPLMLRGACSQCNVRHKRRNRFNARCHTCNVISPRSGPKSYANMPAECS